MRKYIYFIIILLFFIAVTGFSAVLFLSYNVYNNRIFYSIDSVPKSNIAIVFGASVKSSTKEPSEILLDRIKVAVDLYKANKVSKILMSGDNSSIYYNEVSVMRKKAIELGVLGDDIVLDYAGFNTYDTCYRANKIFSLNKDVIIITQKYHIKRALYDCNKLGVDSYGVVSDLRNYAKINSFKFREFFAFIKTFYDVNISKKQATVLGDKINIDF